MLYDRVYEAPNGVVWVGAILFRPDAIYSSWRTLEGDALSWHRFPVNTHPADLQRGP